MLYTAVTEEGTKAGGNTVLQVSLTLRDLGLSSPDSICSALQTLHLSGSTY